MWWDQFFTFSSIWLLPLPLAALTYAAIDRPYFVSRRPKIIRDADLVVDATLFRIPDDYGTALVDLKFPSLFHGRVIDGGDPPQGN
jgi:hypothetical protein